MVGADVEAVFVRVGAVACDLGLEVVAGWGGDGCVVGGGRVGGGVGWCGGEGEGGWEEGGEGEEIDELHGDGWCLRVVMLVMEMVRVESDGE